VAGNSIPRRPCHLQKSGEENNSAGAQNPIRNHSYQIVAHGGEVDGSGKEHHHGKRAPARIAPGCQRPNSKRSGQP